ncbi:MAG: FAD-binding domain-containing protein [Rubripirellula sp.]
MQVIWFKKDLRTEDHRPLFEAAKHGSCVCLYIYESELIQSAEYDTSHHDFLNESLAELDQSLRELGSHLVLRVGEVTQVLGELHERHPIETLWSHEETGNGITYARDQRVKAWAKANQVQWKEYAQTGVVRCLKNRDGWSRARNQMMSKEIIAVPESIQAVTGLERGRLYDQHEFGLPKNEKSRLIAGGEKTAHELLDSFLRNRGQHYSREMSSPVTAHDACSRLSASITWGCISVRQIVSALRQRQEDVRQAKKDGMPTGGWLSSLKSFDARLSWHCHFMQKLEDEPTIEFENMSRSYDGLRESDFSQERFEAWCDGQTGYPMIDACMRALRQHSWINFRMRAMLVSFSSYHLWLHWRQPAIHLAKHFLDFEPGIHFSQVQMQSGTTGINTVRIYSPIKQVKDQDPRGEFIKQYVPELAGVPDKHLPEPHKMSRDQQNQSGCWIGRDYPEPIVDHLTAYRAAKERIYAVRKQASTREEARRVVKKHGSRKGPTQPSRRTRQSAS